MSTNRPAANPAIGESATVATPEHSQLKPKEHGAYAILGIPITTAILIAGPSVVGGCIAIAAISGFLAHEPLLVAWGHRGRRAQSSNPKANAKLVQYLMLTILAGGFAVYMGSTSVQLSLFICCLAAGIGFTLAVQGLHRSRAGQLWGVVGLSVPCVPILLAGEISLACTLAIWAAWLLGFTSTTVAVQSVNAAQKRRSRVFHALTIAAVTAIVTTIAIWPDVATEHPIIPSVIPMVAASWFLLFRPPPAKYLKRVGWTLVFTTTLSAILMTWTAGI